MRFSINTTYRNILLIVLALVILQSIHIPLLGYVIFRLLGVAFTVNLVLTLSLVLWLLTLLPSPLREIGSIFVILWFLSTFALFGSWSWIVMLVLVMFLFMYMLGALGG